MQGAQWRGVGERDRIRENERTGTHAHAYEGCAAVSWFVSVHVQIFKRKANAEKRGKLLCLWITERLVIPK